MACSICGSDEVDVVDFVSACRDCGCQLEGPQLVVRSSDAAHPPQKRERPGEHSDGLDLSQCQQRSRTKEPSRFLANLGLEAAGTARELALPDSVAQAARQAVHSHLSCCAIAVSRAPRSSAVAALLVVAARLLREPLTLHRACERLQAPLHPTQRLLTLVLRRLPEPLPAASVRTAMRLRCCLRLNAPLQVQGLMPSFQSCALLHTTHFIHLVLR